MVSPTSPPSSDLGPFTGAFYLGDDHSSSGLYRAAEIADEFETFNTFQESYETLGNTGLFTIQHAPTFGLALVRPLASVDVSEPPVALLIAIAVLALVRRRVQF